MEQLLHKNFSDFTNTAASSLSIPPLTAIITWIAINFDHLCNFCHSGYGRHTQPNVISLSLGTQFRTLLSPSQMVKMCFQNKWTFLGFIKIAVFPKGGKIQHQIPEFYSLPNSYCQKIWNQRIFLKQEFSDHKGRGPCCWLAQAKVTSYVTTQRSLIRTAVRTFSTIDVDSNSS